MQTLEKTLYTARATAFAGRDGSVKTDDGALDLKVTPPKSMGGAGGATNPEQLFAAGYSACFGSAVMHVARMQKITTGPVAITAQVSLGPVGQGFGLAVELEAKIPELPRDVAQKLVEAAHLVCPYSNATRGNIAVNLTVA
ncbi:MAG: organic hydroperoxide resistance protein [Archangium sp.]|nr:organic hydroperoxide resistance protein [Archangium sp.]